MTASRLIYINAFQHNQIEQIEKRDGYELAGRENGSTGNVKIQKINNVETCIGTKGTLLYAATRIEG